MVIVEKLLVPQLVETFSEFYGTIKSITSRKSAIFGTFRFQII
jgi:hypothetical protein